MAVYADEKQRTFTLQTKNTTYQMKVDAYGMLLHTYYGEKTDNSDLSYRIPPDDRGFSGYAYEASCADDRLSSDLAPPAPARILLPGTLPKAPVWIPPALPDAVLPHCQLRGCPKSNLSQPQSKPPP